MANVIKGKESVQTLVDGDELGRHLRERMRLLTPLEVTKLLEISPFTLNDWRVKRTGPDYVKVGRLIYYFEDQVLEWLLHNRRNRHDNIPFDNYDPVGGDVIPADEEITS